MKKRAWTLLLAAVLAVSMLAGCGGNGESSEPSAQPETAGGAGAETGTVDLVCGLSGTWSSLKIWNGPSTYSAGLQDLIFEPLAKAGTQGLEYRNAKSIDVSEDGTVWTCHLDENVTWSDGVPTTAEDWVWTFETITDPSFGVYDTSYIPFVLVGTDASGVRVEGEELGIKAIDQYTLELTFKTPTALDAFFGWYGYYFRALPKHLLEDVAPADLDTCDFWSAPVGNGPLTFVAEPVTGQEITFAARDDYYKGSFQFDTVTYRVISTDNATSSLLSGEIDSYFTIADFDSVDRLVEAENVTITPLEGAADIYSMSINNEKFNANVRKALSMLIDRETIVAAVTNGYGFPKMDPVMDAGFDYQRDVEAAKAILDAEGFDYSQVISLACGSQRVNMATIIQQNWEEAGVKCEIQQGETAQIFADAISGAVDCCLMANSMTYNPTTEESILDPAGTTYGRIQDSKYIDLCSAIDFETDPAKKAEMVDEFVQLMRDEAPNIYLYGVSPQVPTSTRLSGVKGVQFDNPWEWVITE